METARARIRRVNALLAGSGNTIPPFRAARAAYSGEPPVFRTEFHARRLGTKCQADLASGKREESTSHLPLWVNRMPSGVRNFTYGQPIFRTP
jgi:hypothetical protein